jgi:hypothetical protein
MSEEVVVAAVSAASVAAVADCGLLSPGARMPLLQRSPNILLIPGTSSVEHLRENVAGAGLQLPHEEIKELNVAHPVRSDVLAGDVVAPCLSEWSEDDPSTPSALAPFLQ